MPSEISDTIVERSGGAERDAGYETTLTIACMFASNDLAI